MKILKPINVNENFWKPFNVDETYWNQLMKIFEIHECY